MIQCCAKWDDDEEEEVEEKELKRSLQEADGWVHTENAISEAGLAEKWSFLPWHPISCALKQCFPGARVGDMKGTDYNWAARP